MSAPAALQRLKIWPVIDELRACLCLALGDDAPCFCGILFGEGTPTDYVGCDAPGAGYVRIVTSYPVGNFPEPDPQARSGVLAYNLAVGVIRLAPFGEGMEPPDADQVRAHAELSAADMQAAWEAVCCLREKFEDMQFTVTQYQPIPNQGGIDGGEWLITIADDF